MEIDWHTATDGSALSSDRKNNSSNSKNCKIILTVVLPNTNSIADTGEAKSVVAKRTYKLSFATVYLNYHSLSIIYSLTCN